MMILVNQTKKKEKKKNRGGLAQIGRDNVGAPRCLLSQTLVVNFATNVPSAARYTTQSNHSLSTKHWWQPERLRHGVGERRRERLLASGDKSVRTCWLWDVQWTFVFFQCPRICLVETTVDISHLISGWLRPFSGWMDDERRCWPPTTDSWSLNKLHKHDWNHKKQQRLCSFYCDWVFTGNRIYSKITTKSNVQNLSCK